jgi:hypothetical protein
VSVPAATAAGRSRAVAAPARSPLLVPPAPRRVSGPTRHPRAASAQAVPAASSRWLAVIDHPWLDRLIRGRAWIAIVAVALLGIVTVQVMLLRVGAQLGAETSKVNALIAANNTARSQIGTLEATGGLYGASATRGMVDPPPNDVTYLNAGTGDAARASHDMRVPSATAIAAEAAAARSSSAASSQTTPLVATPQSTTTTTTTGATGATGATSQAGATGATGTAAAGGATGVTAIAGTGATAGAGTTAAVGATTTATGTTAATTGATTAGGTTQPGAGATTTTTGPAPGTATSTPPPTTAAGGVAAPTTPQGG